MKLKTTPFPLASIQGYLTSTAWLPHPILGDNSTIVSSNETLIYERVREREQQANLQIQVY